MVPPGYAVVNLRASWQPGSAREGVGWELLAKVNNVFDRRYENVAAVSDTLFDAQARTGAARRRAMFVAPGAPRSVAVTARYRF